jgi:hypothetical protein
MMPPHSTSEHAAPGRAADDIPIAPGGLFAGFAPGKPRTITLPTAFFIDLLPLIDDVHELKLTLFVFYAVQQREGRYRYLRHGELLVNEALHRIFGMAAPAETAVLEAAIGPVIRRACERGTLLCAELALGDHPERLYFINAEPGRTALAQIAAGLWQPGEGGRIEILPERPGIFQLYEANIGPLTPIVADRLRDAEKTYPRVWIEDAITTAVEKNARNWRFIEAVLDRREKEGKYYNGQSADGKHPQADGKRYIPDRYADWIES